MKETRSSSWLVVARHVTANLRDLRAKAGLTQEELAAQANLDAKHVQAIEGGPSNVTLRVLVSIADALGVAPSRLLAEAPTPKRRPVGRPKTRRTK